MKMSQLSVLLILLNLLLCGQYHSAYSENRGENIKANLNTTKICNRFNEGTEENFGMWSSLLEQYTIESSDHSRQGKYLSPKKQFPTSGRVYITRRIGEAYESTNQRPSMPIQEIRPPPPLMQMHSSQQITKRIDNQPTKPIHFRPGNGRLNPTEISETDLYLLGAIEKLVYRVDYLEKRLKKTDELVLYLMEKHHQQEAATHQHSQGNQNPIKGQSGKPINQSITQNTTQQLFNEKQDSLCPGNATKIGDNCYIVEYTHLTDWQSANAFCKSMAGSSLLLEFNTYKEYYDVGLFLNSSKKYKKHNYWLGGLNPGLLWIWSSTAKPVNPFKNELSSGKNDVTTVDTSLTDFQGSGRCLSYSRNSTSKRYIYFGQNCDLKMGYLCKLFDLTVENEISRIAKALRAEKYLLQTE